MKFQTVTSSKAASPVRDVDEIALIYRSLKKLRRYREAELFKLGCNCALRIGDLLSLTFEQVMEEDGQTVKKRIRMNEEKTGKYKEIDLNPMARDAIKELSTHHYGHIYLFQTTGYRRGKEPKPVTKEWVGRVFKTVKEHLALDYNFSSHSMRKTFAYHAYKNGEDINVLQKLLNHSRVTETFIYIGIDAERVSDVYHKHAIKM